MRYQITALLAGLMLATGVTAGPKPNELDRLRDGGDLTPMGSERAGNAAGTIPAWTGGIQASEIPAGFEAGDHHPDPFPNDEILFKITGQNYQDYSDNLTPGQMAMFARYPDTYFMNVYPSRRTASFPEPVYETTIQNGGIATTINGGEGLKDATLGFPFPFPETAKELLWNHRLKYKGTGGARWNNQAVVTAGGSYNVVELREELLGLYYHEGETIESIKNILLYFFQEVEAPARLAGTILLVHETLNQVEQPRQAWVYNPGQRRVRRAPNIAYDNPGTASDNLRTTDMTDMFNGDTSRFDYGSIVKRELLVPYNSYKVHSDDLKYKDLVEKGHLNQDLMRYELHRVWVVNATVKEGQRHINSRRTYYLDEDSYQPLLADHYDSRQEIWRLSEGHSINYYEVPTFWTTVEVHYDLQSGRYIALGLDNQKEVNTFNEPLAASNYTPQALRKRGRR